MFVGKSNGQHSIRDMGWSRKQVNRKLTDDVNLQIDWERKETKPGNNDATGMLYRLIQNHDCGVWYVWAESVGTWNM